jgi:hypothetical protein
MQIKEDFDLICGNIHETFNGFRGSSVGFFIIRREIEGKL